MDTDVNNLKIISIFLTSLKTWSISIVKFQLDISLMKSLKHCAGQICLSKICKSATKIIFDQVI